MKKITIFLFLFGLLLFNQEIKAQTIKFEYDEAGNRTLRYKTVTLTQAKKDITDTVATQPQKEMMGTREVLIYPNPTRGALRIEIKGPQPETAMRFILTDMSGHVLATNQTTSFNYMYDMTSYPAAIYFLRIEIDGKRRDWKIVKE